MKSFEGFSPEFFRANRTQLRDAFGGTATIVIAGNSYLQRSTTVSFPFCQDGSFWYLTGINEPGMILVMEPTKSYIISGHRDEVRIAFEGNIDDEIIMNISGVDDVYQEDEGWSKLAKRAKKSKHIATLQPSPAYIDHFDMFTNPSRSRLVSTLKEHNEDLDFIDLSPFMKVLRAVKSDQEVVSLRRAIKETSSLFALIEKKRHNAKSENNILADITKQTIDRNLSFAFDPIIASGSNSATIHYVQNDAVIKKDELLLLDIGIRYNGYCADITRTVMSNPTPRHQQVFDSVLSVQDFAISLLKPGADLKTYEEAVANYMGEKLRELGLIKTINKKSIHKYNPTRASHFLGIDTHDAGDYDRPLESGMVITVEPGIYIPEEGIGVRLEDDIMITETGYENLSDQLPKSLTSLTIKP